MTSFFNNAIILILNSDFLILLLILDSIILSNHTKQSPSKYQRPLPRIKVGSAAKSQGEDLLRRPVWLSLSAAVKIILFVKSMKPVVETLKIFVRPGHRSEHDICCNTAFADTCGAAVSGSAHVSMVYLQSCRLIFAADAATRIDNPFERSTLWCHFLGVQHLLEISN